MFWTDLFKIRKKHIFSIFSSAIVTTNSSSPHQIEIPAIRSLARGIGHEKKWLSMASDDKELQSVAWLAFCAVELSYCGFCPRLTWMKLQVGYEFLQFASQDQFGAILGLGAIVDQQKVRMPIVQHGQLGSERNEKVIATIATG